MIERRLFLKMTGAGSALIGSAGWLSACSPEGDNRAEVAAGASDDAMPEVESMPKEVSTKGPDRAYGVQVYTLRNELEVDVRQVLDDLAEAGYKEVELYGLGTDTSPERPFFGLSAADFKTALGNAGLAAPVSHMNGDAMNIPVLAEVLQEIGGAHLVVAMAPEFTSFENGRFSFVAVTDREQLDPIVERLNRQGEMARANGVGFGYHNHHIEFESLGDGTAFDYLFSQTDADLVKIELDLGWTIAAGMDPVALLRRHAGRVLSVHLKDFDPGLDTGDAAVAAQAQMVEPGGGPTDFRPIIEALDDTGVAHRFVEIDLSPEPVAAVARGYQYLASL